MSLPSSGSTTTSSPSLNNILRSPEREDVAAAAHFNPLFIHTGNATHNHNSHKYNSYNTHSSNQTTTNSLNQNSKLSTNSSNLIAAEQSSINHSKLAANTSSSPMQAGAPSAPSRKVHVVYYLSRSGQLEHPHLLEVSIPPNQGLYLRDVKRRLAVIRGKRLPSTFAWSYKRSYKNGYVWQDLCDDDLIFPAHGCEYVLKGSEILNDQRSCSAEEECGPTTNAEAGQATQSNGAKEHLEGLTTRDPKVVYQNFYDDSVRAAGPVLSHVSMVESGTDAATQTEEDLRPASDDGANDQGETTSNGFYSKQQDLMHTKHSSNFSPHRGTCTTIRPQNAIELNNADLASPPSSSSATNSPSPYKEIASTSSSSNSGFTVATDCHSVRDSSGDHAKPISESINPGSKTPGRPWIKKAIQKLEEQDEMLCLHAAENAGESGANGLSSTHKNAAGANVKYRSTMAGNGTVASVILDEGTDQSLASSTKPSRGKHSSALSLLQFMSCGGLDIKEQILPMSLYRLRSKGTPATANQFHMSNYVLSPEHMMPESFTTYGGSESGKLWTKLGKPKSLCLNGSGSKPLFKLSGEFTSGESDGRNQHGSRHYSHSVQQAKSPSTVANDSSAKPVSASIPDVISIGRSSISDRSTNVSHELEYYVSDMHSRLKKSGEVVNGGNGIIKCSPRFNARTGASPELQNNEGIRSTMMATLPARALSGEILTSKGSPLFVPGKRHLSYSGTPLNYVGNSVKPLAQLVSAGALETHHEARNNAMLVKQADGYSKSICSSSSCNPSRAFSDGEVSCMLTSRNALMGKSGEQRSATLNGYDQSMAQLWEELLAAPASMSEDQHQQRDADFHRVRQVTTGSSSSSAWEVERTLQNAVELSLQLPLEHHLLHVDCPRKMKAADQQVTKAHVKSCSISNANVAKSAATTTTTNNNKSSSCLNANLQQAFTKSPNNKSDSNLCQRFLRSPPPLPSS